MDTDPRLGHALLRDPDRSLTTDQMIDVLECASRQAVASWAQLHQVPHEIDPHTRQSLFRAGDVIAAIRATKPQGWQRGRLRRPKGGA